MNNNNIDDSLAKPASHVKKRKFNDNGSSKSNKANKTMNSATTKQDIVTNKSLFHKFNAASSQNIAIGNVGYKFRKKFLDDK